MRTSSRTRSFALVVAFVGLASASCREPVPPASAPSSTSGTAPTPATPSVAPTAATPSAAPPDTPELLELQSTCNDRQDAAACARAASLLDQAGKGAEALSWWQVACDFGGAPSCIEVARRSPPPAPLSSSPGYRRACELGLREGCLALGFMAEKDGLQEQSEEWFAKACMLGDNAACGRSGKKNLAKAESTLREKCAAKDGNACISLAGLPGDGLDARLRWLERTCAKANGFACFARGQATPRAKRDERAAWMKKACALDVKVACPAAPSE